MLQFNKNRGIMKTNNKKIIIYSIFIMLVILIYFGYQIYNKNLITKTLYNYFKDNNSHISSHDFNIEDLEIVCKGKDAYIVDFIISFDDIPNELHDLGALLHKKDKVWNVESFLSKEVINNLDSYNFKCYNKKE